MSRKTNPPPDTADAVGSPPSPTRETKQAGFRYPHANAGLILIADIEEFSPMPEDDQQAAVTVLWEFVQQHDFTGRGNSRYDINGEGEGPVGRAFVQRKAVVACHLPQFDKKNPNPYLRAIAPWGIRETAINLWQRKARSFISIPFGITDMESDGVLCIDMEDPLAAIDEARLQDIASKLRATYSDIFSALWALRTH